MPSGTTSAKLCGESLSDGCNWATDSGELYAPENNLSTDIDQSVVWHVNLEKETGGKYFGNYILGLIQGDHSAECQTYTGCEPFLVATTTYVWQNPEATSTATSTLATSTAVEMDQLRLAQAINDALASSTATSTISTSTTQEASTTETP